MGIIVTKGDNPVNAALNALDKIIKERLEKGWVWMERGETRRLISPDEKKNYLSDKWKIVK